MFSVLPLQHPYVLAPIFVLFCFLHNILCHIGTIAMSICFRLVVHSVLLPVLFSVWSFQGLTVISLVPRPRPAFRRFQYGKAGEGLVSFLT